MAINAIAYNEVIRYTLPNDKNNPTIWLIGALDSITQDKIMKQYMEYDINDPDVKPRISANFDPFVQEILIVKLGLKGFENFKLRDKQLQFKTEKITLFGEERVIVSDEIIKHIPSTVIHQLSRIIWDANIISEDEEKN